MKNWIRWLDAFTYKRLAEILPELSIDAGVFLATLLPMILDEAEYKRPGLRGVLCGGIICLIDSAGTLRKLFPGPGRKLFLNLYKDFYILSRQAVLHRRR